MRSLRLFFSFVSDTYVRANVHDDTSIFLFSPVVVVVLVVCFRFFPCATLPSVAARVGQAEEATDRRKVKKNPSDADRKQMRSSPCTIELKVLCLVQEKSRGNAYCLIRSPAQISK